MTERTPLSRIVRNKVVRRRILQLLYSTWEEDPNATLAPGDVTGSIDVTREDLRRNVAYLEAAGYVECMRGFGSQTFGCISITVRGIDLVEDPREFDRRFPPIDDDQEGTEGSVRWLLSELRRLIAEDKALQTENSDLLTDLECLEVKLAVDAKQRNTSRIAAAIKWIEESVPAGHAARDLLHRLKQAVER